MAFLRYSPDLEQIGEDEAETFASIAETFRSMGEEVRAQEGRAVRVSHAKSTGLLTGKLVIDGDLAPELAQGLASSPREYDTLVRLAQGPGEILDDTISTHRGMAVKVLGVEGERKVQAREGATQDFLLEAGKTSFLNSNATRFLANLRAGVSNAPKIPEAMKSAVSSVSRAANAPLEAIGAGSKTLAFFGHPRLHPLAERYFSQAPMRWGDYVAKVGFFPTQNLLDSLSDREVGTDDGENAFRSAVIEHFATRGAAFELCIQLATTTDETPIEDAAREWPEETNPYRRVGTLHLPLQAAWSQVRSDYFDERLSFMPANSLVAHRPLGQIMRARLFVYDRLRAFRQGENNVQPFEPHSLADVPV